MLFLQETNLNQIEIEIYYKIINIVIIFIHFCITIINFIVLLLLLH